MKTTTSKQKAKDQLEKIVKHINGGTGSVAFFVGSRETYAIMREVAMWNKRYHTGKESYEIYATFLMKTHKIKGVEVTGFQICFWNKFLKGMLV